MTAPEPCASLNTQSAGRRQARTGGGRLTSYRAGWGGDPLEVSIHVDGKSGPPAHALLEHAESEAWAEIQSHVGESFRDRFGVRVHRVGCCVVLVAPRTDMLALNRAWLPGSAPSLRPDVLDEVTAVFREAVAPRFVVHWPPAALPVDAPDWFAERGFRVGHPMAKLYRRTNTALAIESIASDLDVIESGKDDGALFGAIAALGNDAPPFMAPGFNSTVGLVGWRHYFAMDGGRPVAAAAMRVRDDVAWCGFAGTMPDHRRRGAQSALLARRVRDAAAAGCTWVTCETMADAAERPSPSFRNMTRLGFEMAYLRTNHVLTLL